MTSLRSPRPRAAGDPSDAALAIEAVARHMTRLAVQMPAFGFAFMLVQTTAAGCAREIRETGDA